jgi:hypothetical protein
MQQLIDEELEDTRHIDLIDGMLEVVALATARHRVLARLVGELAPDGTPAYIDHSERGGLPGYRPAAPAGIYGPDHLGDAKPHVLIGMLNDAEDRRLKALKVAADTGIDERRVQLAEDHAQRIASVLRFGATLMIDFVASNGAGDDLLRSLRAEMPRLLRAAIDATATESPIGDS